MSANLPFPPPPPAPPPPATSPRTPPGWYPDPWGVAHYRWWDGYCWAANVATYTGTAARRRPRLPAWLSVPVLVGGILLLPLLGFTVAEAPVVLALALVPLLFIVPLLVWFDRLEPEPWASRIHAFAWGGTISVLVASVVNVTVLLTAGEAWAAVGSAPLIEETMKGLGILWAVRRREVDGPTDGIVYAGWVAAGFAMVENLEYFLVASDDGVLAETFVARALVTPFAHPLFTVWIGLAIGLAVAKRRRLPWAAWWGWLIAVGLHAGWNGAIVAAISADDDRIVWVAGGAFLIVFVLTVILVMGVRRSEKRAYLAAMPYVAQRYGLTLAEVGVFSTWPEMLGHRRALSRRQRRRFDDLHAALARLVALHARGGQIDAIDEQRLVAQLQDARTAMRTPRPR